MCRSFIFLSKAHTCALLNLSPSVVSLGGDPLIGLLLRFFGVPTGRGGPLHDDAGVFSDSIHFAPPSSSSLLVRAGSSTGSPLDSFLQEQSAKGR